MGMTPVFLCTVLLDANFLVFPQKKSSLLKVRILKITESNSLILEKHIQS